MENDFLLCRECVELASEPVKITVYHRGAFLMCALENSVFREVGYPAMEALLVPCTAFDAQCTVSHG